MGFLSNWFKRKRIVTLHDPVFGYITWEQGIWTFLPEKLTEGFMIEIDAPQTGPTEFQRAFFTRLRPALPEYEQRARDYIARQAEKDVDPAQLTIYAVQIENDEETAHEAFLMELADAEASVVHWVAFRAGQPEEYGCDD